MQAQHGKAELAEASWCLQQLLEASSLLLCCWTGTCEHLLLPLGLRFVWQLLQLQASLHGLAGQITMG